MCKFQLDTFQDSCKRYRQNRFASHMYPIILPTQAHHIKKMYDFFNLEKFQLDQYKMRTPLVSLRFRNITNGGYVSNLQKSLRSVYPP